nr:flagellar type III secretion system pore protein FliP [Lachnospiraceae bacterium]
MNKRVLRMCAMALVLGIFVFMGTMAVHATTMDSNFAGQTEDRTNINEPGTSETPDELADLNIANTMTITYNDGNGTVAGPIRILLVLTAIAIAPTLLICLTSYTRILIVMHFTRQALNTQTAPPNQVIIGLALFLTYFIMSPTITEINEQALIPFEAGELSQEEALEAAAEPIRDFMYKQTQLKDAKMFCEIGGYEWTGELEDIPTSALIPAFMVSELRTAFIIGFVIYVPFLVIDMVVSSALMSMGMMMLPPTTISMPFKILLFVLADGWNLVIVNLVKTFM